MKVSFIKPSYEIDMMGETGIEKLKRIEKCSRTCYKSESKITDTSYEALINMLKKNGHTAMFEFASVSVKFITNRSFSHQAVRQRICSFAQESQRFCNYGETMTFIIPDWSDMKPFEIPDIYKICDDDIRLVSEAKRDEIWIISMLGTASDYQELLSDGLRPEQARGVLPNDSKTEINICTNLREWMHIFDLRDSKKADPDMRRLMSPLHEDFKKLIPIVFD